MREIKFRLWDCDNNRFEYVNFNDLELLRQSLDGFEDYFHKDYFKNSPTYIQQFAGLKDKNGVDIYKGDIEKEYGEIEDMMEFYLYINFNLIANEDLEIIGNIHENEL